LRYPHYIQELKKNALLTHDAAQPSVADAAAKGFAQGGEHGMAEAELSQQRKLYEKRKIVVLLGGTDRGSATCAKRSGT
jgi:hypothetical protein